MEALRVCESCGRYVPRDEWPCDVCIPYDTIANNSSRQWPLGIHGAEGATEAGEPPDPSYLLRRGIAIVAGFPGRPAVKARLTTDHPLSQGGSPVLMVDFQSYAPGEITWIDGPPWARQAASSAGYPVVSDEESTWPEGVWRPWFGWEEAEPVIKAPAEET